MRLCLLFLLLPLFSQAQLDTATYKPFEDSLVAVGKRLITSRDLAVRRAAADQILPLLQTQFSGKEGYAYPLDSIDYISVQRPADDAFRIFTWQLYVDENHYEYFGALQYNNGTFVPFKESKEIDDPEFEITDETAWMGVVYYKIEQFKTDGLTQYLLFGYNAHSLFEQQKIIEVLVPREDYLQFGSPVFFLPDGKRAEKRRVVLTYSVTASVTCNYDEELERIMYDHLIVGSGPRGNPTLVPDGSYEAYQLKKGKWVYEEKVFHEVLEEAPRPKPILDGAQGKDLFGKPKNKPE